MISDGVLVAIMRALMMVWEITGANRIVNKK